jgi:hypothetical protein
MVEMPLPERLDAAVAAEDMANALAGEAVNRERLLAM